MKNSLTVLLCFIFTAAFFFNNCAFGSDDLLTDEKIRTNIIGVWIVDETFTNGLFIKGTVTINADGSYIGRATLIIQDKTMIEMHEGMWRIENGYLIETTTKTNSKLSAVGHVTRDKVIYVNADEFSYQTEKGIKTNRKRKK